MADNFFDETYMSILDEELKELKRQKEEKNFKQINDIKKGLSDVEINDIIETIRKNRPFNS